MLEPGARSCTALATARKVFTYALGCWPQAYQDPFISCANRTTTGTPVSLTPRKRRDQVGDGLVGHRGETLVRLQGEQQATPLRGRLGGRALDVGAVTRA